MGMQGSIAEAVSGLIEVVSGDVEDICREAKSSNIADWKAAQLSKSVAVGAGSAIVPLAGYLTLPADLAATLRIMHRAATGITYLRLGHADDDTFGSILAVWSGAVTLDNALAKQAAAKGLAIGGTTIGGPIGLQMAIKGISVSAGVLVTKKLGPKVAQKVAAKIAAKLTAKATTRWIPGLSAVVGGGVNAWIINEICKATDEYCEFVQKIAK
jgi:hypothetical protein